MNSPCLISIIIPVYREAEIIQSLLNQLENSQELSNTEIIVTDGDTANSTIDKIQQPHILKINATKGRGSQMNAAAKIANGDIFLFLHADSKLPQNALQEIRNVLKTNKYVGGAFSLDIESPELKYSLLSILTTWRSKLNRIPYGDQAIFIRKEVFFKLGMYKELPLLEDVEFTKALKKRRYKIKILNSRIKTSARRWKKYGFFRCIFNHRLIACLHWLGFSPESLTHIYWRRP